MTRKVNIAQTEIPVGNAVGYKHDSDEAYEREFGPERAAEQRRLYVEARKCTCSSTHKDK
jgi:hypothetical protein